MLVINCLTVNSVTLHRACASTPLGKLIEGTWNTCMTGYGWILALHSLLRIYAHTSLWKWSWSQSALFCWKLSSIPPLSKACTNRDSHIGLFSNSRCCDAGWLTSPCGATYRVNFKTITNQLASYTLWNLSNWTTFIQHECFFKIAIIAPIASKFLSKSMGVCSFSSMLTKFHRLTALYHKNVLIKIPYLSSTVLIPSTLGH